jgi:hypothetical protein
MAFIIYCVVVPGGGILGLSPKDEGCEMWRDIMASTVQAFFPPCLW